MSVTVEIHLYFSQEDEEIDLGQEEEEIDLGQEEEDIDIDQILRIMYAISQSRLIGINLDEEKYEVSRKRKFEDDDSEQQEKKKFRSN